MMSLWRLPAVAAVLAATAAVASAQTVMVRHAPANMSVELLLNDAVAATGTTNPDGEVSLDLKMPEPGAMDANIFVDVCEKSRRVLVVDRNKRPSPPPAGCERREISGVFWVRRINTLAVDVGGLQPSMLLVKGSYTPPRPSTVDENGETTSTPHRPSPTGLNLFGGAGFGQFTNVLPVACGNASPCAGNNGGLGYTFGATYWVTRWLAAEGSFLKPRKSTAKGGDTFAFNSAFDVDVYTITAKAAIPAGPVRIYGLGGTNYHQSTLTMVETIETLTQTFTQKTHGWNWVYGGGVEGWVTKKVALYGEVSRAKIKGPAEDKGEGFVDDHLRFFSFGARILLSR
jgi:hypothetical protein